MGRPSTPNPNGTADRDGFELPFGIEQMLKEGLSILWRAFHYARDLRADPRGFAVPLASLQEAGLTVLDLRWMLAHGWVEIVSVSPFPEHHVLLPTAVCQLSTETSAALILTESGAIFAARILQGAQLPSSFTMLPVNGDPVSLSHVEYDGCTVGDRPHWDRDQRELRYRAAVVKQFRWSAVNQETILMAFQEDGWPGRIDDPLPQQLNQDAKQRLHDTIKCLNRNQKNPLIRFLGDGTGTGVLWRAQRVHRLAR